MAAKFGTLLAVLAIAQLATACVHLMGDAPDSVAAHTAATPWNYALRGDNWEGITADNKTWTCSTGTLQSPLNLQSHLCATGSSSVKTTWSYSPLTSNGSNIGVYNNGHTIQVQWTAGALESNVVAYANTKITDVLDPANAGSLKPVKLTPLQFHFHTTSEHMIDGAYAPIEMHIVHSIPQSVLPGCPASGCLSVVGIMMHVSEELEEGLEALDVIFGAMSEQEGVVEYLEAGAVLDIDALLPPADQRSYMQYEGSLTTPPCTEGLLWHVLTTPVYISEDQYNAYAHAVGLKECTKTNETRRMLKEHGHHHHHAHTYADLLGDVLAFERGSYSGFVRGDELRQTHGALKKRSASLRKANRKLQDSSYGAGANAGTWQCEVVAYGWTNRNVQDRNDRTIVAYA